MPGDPVLSARRTAGPGLPRLAALRDDAAAWCEGRSGWVRLPLLAYGAWILVHALSDVGYQSWFAGLNLGIHELGHIVLSPIGPLIGAAGGAIFQVLAPAAGAAGFWRQRDYFALAFSFGWLSTNLFGIARYVGDARSQSLPLVSPFAGQPIHDWAYVLGRLDLLAWDRAFAGAIRVGAVAAMGVFLVAGSWLVLRMIRD